MITVILVIHLLIAVAMVALILLQRAEGGALGIGGGGAGLMTGRQAGNLLTRMTGLLAGAFMITSLGLALLSGSHAPTERSSVLDAEPVAPSVPSAPAVPAPPVSGSETPAPGLPVPEASRTEPAAPVAPVPADETSAPAAPASEAAPATLPASDAAPAATDQ
ncbi:preprotein translocase subunit SecG [Pararhodospirillum oryzae]|uniref:Protein-export membrane protein SecG n=1 Tax=Pararhodospirillum oryzae TaxID=478448 RepID=A0A512H8X6_9PROT|nr:preprotein translocase subunit SecG [Pararhodospirillum oryzae]GEO81868.1 preprotein translocase subunit SecG [Pararhodospirillum oryzae]